MNKANTHFAEDIPPSADEVLEALGRLNDKIDNMSGGGSEATLGTKEVGSIVKLKVNGTPTDFIVVNQGKPSDIYDDSCNGTWLLMKDVYENRQWSASNNSYSDSSIHSYLNSTFLNLFDANIKAAIKQVKVPYKSGTESSGAIMSGASGLSAKIFLLSGYEAGWTTSTNSYFPVDGAVLSYFSGTAATDAKRVATLNGSATSWWLRSPFTLYTSSVWFVFANGSNSDSNCSSGCGVRPALILDPSALVDGDGNIKPSTLADVAYTGSYNDLSDRPTIPEMPDISGKLDKSGGTMTGILYAQSNTSYTTAQVRNVTMSTSNASGGSNGQIHFKYS